MSRKVIFVVSLTVLLCLVFLLNENALSTSEVGNEKDMLAADDVSHALKIALNDYIWYNGDNSWYSTLCYKELNYEYYIKTHSDYSVENDEIAVLITQPLQIGFTNSRGYFVFCLTKNKFSFATEINTSWHRDTIEELMATLENYNRLGEGSVIFDNITKPNYSEDSWQKFYIVQCISREFLEHIGHPNEITELYILDFYEFSDRTKILYSINNKDYIVSFSMITHNHDKPIPIGETPTGVYYDEYYKSQFIKSAYKMDLSNTSSPKILECPPDE